MSAYSLHGRLVHQSNGDVSTNHLLIAAPSFSQCPCACSSMPTALSSGGFAGDAAGDLNSGHGWGVRARGVGRAFERPQERTGLPTLRPPLVHLLGCTIRGAPHTESLLVMEDSWDIPQGERCVVVCVCVCVWVGVFLLFVCLVF